MKDDLAWAIAQVPPPLGRKKGIFDDPQLQQWLFDLVKRRDAGERFTNKRIADVLNILAQKHGLIPKDKPITETNVSRYLRSRSRG